MSPLLLQTDLCGIKWRKLVWPEGQATHGGEVSLDPVLLSFSRCLQADILCVWRRVGRRPPPPDDSALLDAPLGAPPPPVAPSIVVHPPLALHAAKELWIFWYGEEPDLSNLVSADLLATESEQGSWESGLSYECRSLLFKALHNLIERCLLSRDLIRLGRWFVLPYEGADEVEGKSPHLSFLFSFFVHGESTVCASVDVRQHPPVRTLSSQVLQQAQSSQAGVPVILAPFGLAGALTGQSYKTVDQRTSGLLEDWKQFYPIDSRNSNCDDSSTPQAVEVIVGGVKMRYPSCYVLVTDADDIPSNSTAQNPKAAGLSSSDEPSPVPPVESPCLRQQSSASSWIKQEPPSPLNIAEITWQESMLSPPSDTSDVPSGHWDFVDPTRKLPCSCSKCRQGGPKEGSASRALIPFHQRAPPRHNQPAKPASRVPCGAGAGVGAGAGHTTPLPERSPQSAAPSPLPNPNSVQPASVPPAEPTMPTLSPQPSSGCTAAHPATPPPAPGPGTPAHTPVDSHGPKSVSSVSNQVYSPYQGGACASVSSVDNAMGIGPMTGGTGPPSAPPASAGPPSAPPQPAPSEHQPLTLKRPVLAAKEYEHLMMEDEAMSDHLYDYSQLDVWLNYPVKKFKPSDIEQKPWSKSSNPADIYPAVQPPASSPPLNGHPATPGTPVCVKSEVKQEPMEDDRADNARKCVSGSLFTSEGLQASYGDLDQIFDNSDTSSDETMQVPTPPGSNKHEDSSCNMRGPRILRPEELSKMFPTPPSLEHNPAASPCGGQTDIDRCDFTELPATRIKQEIYPNMGSPQEEAIDDWSFVFRPPSLYKFVGSSKYAPLRDLPSQDLPPVSLPGNCSYKPSWLYPPPQEKTTSSDTALNIFRDHNFDSCTVCVCNSDDRKVACTIRGADAGVYLAPYGPHPLNEDDSTRCTCGFSAVVNRRLSHRAGLFYEDEFEITGIADEPNLRNGLAALDIMTLISSLSNDVPDTVRPIDVLSLMKEQCGVMVRSPASALIRAAQKTLASTSLLTVNALELGDSNEASWVAMEQGLMVSAARVPCMHRWPFLRAAGPECSQDIVRVMKSLQPQLQEAVQGKCTTRLWEAPYTVSGPLTWRQFHRLAGRGTEDRCEPQPIPSMMVGYEKDWLSLSPYALHYWEKLLLEPYSYARDVAYIVVAPENDFVINRCRSFFKELSTVYEVCRLGRHCPITKGGLRDGILRVGSSAAIKLAEDPTDKRDDWFSMLGDSPTANMLRLYAKVCRRYLVPHLLTVTQDKILLESSDGPQPKTVERPAPSPMPPPSADSDKGPNTPKSDHDGDGSRDPLAGVGSSQDTSHIDDEEREPPAIVIYLVEPFTVGSESSDVERLACIGLLKCFSSVVQEMPENLRNNMAVQVVSLESIVEQSKTCARSDYMRSVALSVYSQCRRVMQHTSNVKALTGFGPAATGDLFLKNKDEKNRAPYRLYSPPYILAPVKEKSDNAEASEECCVLYLSYCLSEDQRWLLASATDERGAILDTTVINIHIPNRSRRKKASVRRIGLQKLMDFILGVMSQSVRPWRLVVGRIGRIGHGELKGWSGLLSRQALLNASKHLKEICGQCVVNVSNNVPCILSACLVSLEPDSALRLMPDQFTPDERFSQTSVNCQLSTPHDVSCTHILVFPTSATTQSSQTAFQEQHITGPGELDLFQLDEDISESIDDLGGFGDIFWQDNPTQHSPGNSPHRDSPNGMNPSSPIPDASGNYNNCHAPARGGDQQEEVCSTLLQQPLALGYMVSTAPTGPMPSWFWASCPHLENVCPCFLKNALHLNNTIQSGSEDLMNSQQPQVSGHPLDSTVTTDVLRYVLEGYNALSWLGLDSNSHDRMSCLPVHMQVLMQLYHMTSALV
ncbi:hypothetical protein ONE63_005583 [Megalurothrips usitatus]|uniref:Mediator of RNA polymerase II transcription subunit 13 n=1 Tax=Megalurothrips usitatus TaxID=439358 RepID=A0AAV7XX12_9NEOP|nr:hypothetical protein ONE63_005583 [Megalurothrips usitatus]